VSRSRPTKLEKYQERRVQIAHETMEWARKELEAAERRAKTPDDPDVILKRQQLADAQKYFQEAYDNRPGYARR
jgi:hypothetical protein